MAALQDMVIKRLPTGSVVYWPSFRENFPLPLDLEESEFGSTSWTRNIAVFSVPMFETQYASFVAASGTVVTIPGVGADTSQSDSAITIKGTSSATMVRLHAVIGAIREARPLPLSAEMDDLLTQATQAHGAPRNIKEWACQLAGEISDLTD